MSPSAGEDECLSLSREHEFVLPLPFCSMEALNYWIIPTQQWGGLSSLGSLLIELLISSGDTFTDIPRNIYQPTEYPLAHSGGHIKLITINTHH